jgi:2-dehydro-3-deoxyphosphogluconate aldolase/(4S)-4-hydroxy-2-oxoglutarate aldolase
MHKKQITTELLLKQKLLPLYYHESSATSVAILQALFNAGIKLIEYTNRGENALQNFIVLKKAAELMPGMQLGIGTIKNKEQANSFINAGADFIVCPSMNEEVAHATHNAGLLWIPGCMTPTEIAAAENAGAAIVKIFPGNILGPSYISAIKELFPSLKFMPTGGVEAEEVNLKNWFQAGVVAVGMGSKLITKKVVEAKDYLGLETATKKVLAIIAEVSTFY